MYNLVNFWSEKCLFVSKKTQQSHLRLLLYIYDSLRLIRTYWAVIEKVDIFTKRPTINRNLATFFMFRKC